MTKSTLSLLLILAYGAVKSLAAVTPSIQLQIGSSPSGCADITTCNYGCARFSSDSVKHVLTPLCESKSLSGDYPRHITIRGSTVLPYIFDEDTSNQYNCTKTIAKGRKYTCTLNSSVVFSESNNTSAIVSASTSVSASVSASASASSGSGSPIIFRDITGSGIPIQCGFFPAIAGKGTGQGSLNDCCLRSTDCRGLCIRGSCNAGPNPTSTSFSTSLSSDVASPSNCAYNPTIFRQHQGQGNLDDCCWTDDDCHGACIEGACNSEKNMPVPVCSGILHKGKGLGQGKKGACCTSQADCQENCIYNTCTAPLN